MEHLHEQSFTWQAWSGGNLMDMLNIPNREPFIVDNTDIIQKYAIGWCKGDNIVCRPKTETIAVMFITNNVEWWTHFTIKEFISCFPELKSEI